ncbi:AAA family ATPase [Clavibacter zhangzhiyongii]|uniref:AAA family ATPase n=1 Tax=Clavibacter zhangzhiyongii TaxID=2768071 RepID=UPI0039DF80E5
MTSLPAMPAALTSRLSSALTARPEAAAGDDEADAGRKFAELSDVDQQRMRAYCEVVRRNTESQLRELSALARPTMDNYTGPPWNATVFDKAIRLVEIANSPWSPLQLSTVRKLIVKHAPRDADFTDQTVEAILTSATAKKAGAGIPMPVGLPELHAFDLPAPAGAEPDDLEADFSGERDATFDGLTPEAVQQLTRRLAADEADRRYRCIRQGARPSFADRLLTRSAIEELPPVEPLVADVLDRGTLAMLYGPSGLGKSTLALDLALCVATGEPWRGKRTTRRSRVLYLYAEGVAGLRQRVVAWETAWGASPSEKRFAAFPAALDLSDAAAVEEAAAVVTARKVDFLIIDTLNASAGALEENSSTAMGQLVAAAKRLVADRPSATVLLIHHSGKDGKLRGSSALFAACDTVLAVAGEPGSWSLTAEKRKDGPTETIGLFKLKPAHGSVIVEGRMQDDAEERVVSTEKALALFRAAFSATGATRTQWRDVLTDSGLGRASAYSAINSLVTSGAVLLDGSTYRLAPASRLGVQ